MQISIEETFERQDNLLKSISNNKKNLTKLNKRLSAIDENYFICEINSCISLWNILNDISNELILTCSIEGRKQNKINGEITTIKEINNVLDYAESEIEKHKEHVIKLIKNSNLKIETFKEKMLLN